MLDVATSHRLTDSRDLIALTIRFGTDWQAWVDEIVSYAFAARHGDPDVHADIAKLADKAAVQLAKEAS